MRLSTTLITRDNGDEDKKEEDCDQAVEGLCNAAKAKKLEEPLNVKKEKKLEEGKSFMQIGPALRGMYRADWAKKFKHLKTQVVETLKRYWLGLKLLWEHVKFCSRLMNKLDHGKSLSRRERQQLTRITADIYRLVPFAVFILMPCIEFLLPVALKMLPSDDQMEGQLLHWLPQYIADEVEAERSWALLDALEDRIRMLSRLDQDFDEYLFEMLMSRRYVFFSDGGLNWPDKSEVIREARRRKEQRRRQVSFANDKLSKDLKYRGGYACEIHVHGRAPMGRRGGCVSHKWDWEKEKPEEITVLCMELTACLVGLEMFDEYAFPPGTIIILLDSEFALETMMSAYLEKNLSVQEVDAWRGIRAYVTRLENKGFNFLFAKVTRESGVDQLAKGCAAKMMKRDDDWEDDFDAVRLVKLIGAEWVQTDQDIALKYMEDVWNTWRDTIEASPTSSELTVSCK